MKFILIILSILIIPGAFTGLKDSLILFVINKDVFYPVLTGFAAAAVLYYVFLRRYEAIQVFEHELTHAFAALLFLRKIRRFVSTSRGGYVSHSGGFGGEPGNVFISLAPYFMPTFTLLLCLARPWVPAGWFPWFDAAAGFTLGYHTVSTIDETIENFSNRTFFCVGTDELSYTDIGKTGLITSFFVIAAWTLTLHGIIFFLFTGGYQAVGGYFTLIFARGRALCLMSYGLFLILADRLSRLIS